MITIDPEFKLLIPPLTPDELERLRESIVEEGCRDPIVLWDGVIVDGHNRHSICTELGLPFETKSMQFDSRDDAADWMDQNQLGRRNLSAEDRRILIGRMYNRTKKAQGGTGANQHTEQSGKSCHSATEPEHAADEPQQEKAEPKPKKTGEAIAKRYGISDRAVRAYAAEAKAHEKIALHKQPRTHEPTPASKDKIMIGNSLPDNPTPAQQKEAREELARITREKQIEKKKKKELAERDVFMEKAKQLAHVAHNSGENEWYTPPELIESARRVMGEIDLDPASSFIANGRVGATQYFSKDDCGLEREWLGKVWMNPPYAKGLIEAFSSKLVNEVGAGRVIEAIVLVNNGTETQWAHDLFGVMSALCLPRRRVKFLDPSGNPGAPLQGQMIVYIGGNSAAFGAEFAKHGKVAYVP